MQSTGHLQAERRSIDAVVETLAAASRSDWRAALSHDARNMITALTLYCDLLEQPGVLAGGYEHYAHELRLLTDASRCLVEKLVAWEQPRSDDEHRSSCPDCAVPDAVSSPVSDPALPLLASAPPDPDSCIPNLAEELEANRNLLDAIAGLGVAVSLQVSGGAVPVRMHGEDLTRILVNLVKNAAEAMQGSGLIHIQLSQRPAEGAPRSLVLTVDDTGPGVPASVREKIFEPGYSTHPGASGGWTAPHRGLGLAICRSLAESAGGRMRVVNRHGAGARFLIELPAGVAAPNKLVRIRPVSKESQTKQVIRRSQIPAGGRA